VYVCVGVCVCLGDCVCVCVDVCVWMRVRRSDRSVCVIQCYGARWGV